MFKLIIVFSLTVLTLPLYAANDGGAACVMAKYNGYTMDYELVYGKSHPVEAQEEAERRLAAKGYDNYYKKLDVIRGQNLTNLRHAYVIVIRSEWVDQRKKNWKPKKRSVVGCGFSARSYEDAMWDALLDAQNHFWGWKPDEHGYELLQKFRY